MTLWHWFALPFFAELCLVLLMLVFTDDAVVLATLPPLLIIVCYDFIEKNASKKLLMIFQWLLATSVDLGLVFFSNRTAVADL